MTYMNPHDIKLFTECDFCNPCASCLSISHNFLRCIHWISKITTWCIYLNSITILAIVNQHLMTNWSQTAGLFYLSNHTNQCNEIRTRKLQYSCMRVVNEAKFYNTLCLNTSRTSHQSYKQNHTNCTTLQRTDFVCWKTENKSYISQIYIHFNVH
jgi:hypothetical protein